LNLDDDNDNDNDNEEDPQISHASTTANIPTAATTKENVHPVDKNQATSSNPILHHSNHNHNHNHRRHRKSLLSSKTQTQTQTQTQPSPQIWSSIQSLYKRGELYRGVKPIVTTLAISNFVFFYAHECIKQMMKKSSSTNSSRITLQSVSSISSISSMSSVSPPSLWKSLLASSLAGVINVLLTNPLWVANMRIVQGNNTNNNNNNNINIKTESTLLSTLQTIVREEGVLQLWSGTLASLLLVSNPTIQFFTYDRLRLHRLHLHPKSSPQSFLSFLLRNKGDLTLSPLEAFVLGAIAKAIATVVTYPLQLAQILLRLQKKKQQQRQEQVQVQVQVEVEPKEKTCTTIEYKNTADCILKLYKKGGITALYSGMNAKLLQTVLTSAFTFLTYEQILKLVQKAFWMVQPYHHLHPPLSTSTMGDTNMT